MYGDVDKISCHKDATAGAKVAKVAAGGSIDIQWTTWPSSHVGPVIDYLAKVDDATSAKAADLEFFKIDAAGYEGGQWASDKLIANNQTWTVTVPSSIAAGQYVLRHEIIALHSAGQENGAQNYPKCINIEVTGSGTETPAGVTGDKLYTATDPGIKVNVYGDNSNYEMPGPALFSGASSGSKPAASAAPSKTAAASTTPAATSAVPAISSVAAKAVSTPAASSAAAAAPTSTGSASIADKEFTLDTFIAWLEEKAGSSSQKVRRHARAFRV
jgi:cellulase